MISPRACCACPGQLDEFRDDPDMSTGHAFITFLYERDRNRLISSCTRTGTQRWLQALLPCCFRDTRPQWASAANATARSARNRPFVDVAPEPDDIIWANLQLDARYHRRIRDRPSTRSPSCIRRPSSGPALAGRWSEHAR